MGKYYTYNIKEFLDSFRRVIGYNSLQEHELHALLNFFDVKIGRKTKRYYTEEIMDYYRKLLDDINDSVRKARVYIATMRFYNHPLSRQEFNYWYAYAVQNHRTADSIKEPPIKKEQNLFGECVKMVLNLI